MSSRAWIAAAFALACRVESVGAPDVPAPPIDVSTPPLQPVRGWEPLVAYRDAALPVPADPDPAACDAAADAALLAGVLDVAAYWRHEALRRAPTPAREQAWRAIRVEAGLDAPAAPPAPIDPALARALRTAVERHAWDEVLALAEPALAASPHHELYFWAGDALWQQGHEAAARRMWSRARLLLRAVKLPLRLRQPDPSRVSQLAWSPAGLAYFREERGTTFLEVRGDSTERPWRRWQRPGRSALAWSQAVLAEARHSTLTLHEPASGVVLASTVAHDDPIGVLAAAAAAPVFATAGLLGRIKVWRWSPAAGLVLAREIATNDRTPKLALDPSGALLAILRAPAAIELVSLADGAGRSIALALPRPLHLRFLDERTLLVGHDGGRVSRVERSADGSFTVSASTDASAFSSAGEPPHPQSTASSNTCGGFPRECHWRRIVPAEPCAAPDGTRRAIARDGGLAVEDPAIGTTVLVPPQVSVKIAGVSHDGGAVAIAGLRGLAVWDTRTGVKRLADAERAFLGFSPDSQFAALSADAPRGVELHPLAGGAPVVLRTDDRVRAFRWSSDGRRAAIAEGDRLAVWDLAAGSPLWTAQLPAPVHKLDFTAAGDLVFQSYDQLYVQPADGSRAPRPLLRGRDLHSWSVSPTGAELLACAYPDAGSVLVDLRTRRPGRRLRGACNPRFIDADTVYLTFQGERYGAHVMNVRSGRAPRELEWAPLNASPVHANGVVFAVRMVAERLEIGARDGRKLASLLPRPDLGWFVVSEHGAVDGDPAALATMETEVGQDPDRQRYPAILAWDGVRVPGLLPRVFAGEDVHPPRIR